MLPEDNTDLIKMINKCPNREEVLKIVVMIGRLKEKMVDDTTLGITIRPNDNIPIELYGKWYIYDIDFVEPFPAICLFISKELNTFEYVFKNNKIKTMQGGYEIIEGLYKKEFDDMDDINSITLPEEEV